MAVEPKRDAPQDAPDQARLGPRKDSPSEPNGDALNRPGGGEAAGTDSSPFDDLPSGEKHKAAQEPQNAQP